NAQSSPIRSSVADSVDFRLSTNHQLAYVLADYALLRPHRFALPSEKRYNRGDRNTVEEELSFMYNLPVEGLKVVDIAVLFASPTISQNMGDFGAEVIKVEHPRSGDSLRTLGAAKNGIPLWWKITNRNKKCITLDLNRPEGQEVLKQLIADADVLTENFRPGTLERWGLGWEVLHAINPRLILVRVSGFGQTGPYKDKPGFGTLAEAMSGFAHITGQPDGPPTLPGSGLADAVAGQFGTWAVMVALYERDHKSGEGQVIDLSVLEPICTILGDQAITYHQLPPIHHPTPYPVP